MAHDASAYAALGLRAGGRRDRHRARLQKADQATSSGPRGRGFRSRRGDQPRLPRASLSARAERCAVLIDDRAARRGGGGWVRAAIVLLLALAVLLAVTGPVGALHAPAGAAPRADASEAAKSRRRGRVGRDESAAPPRRRQERRAPRPWRCSANVTIWRCSAPAAIATAALRIEPSVTQLDRCAAFDDAIVQLEDRDPMWDQGPFSQIAVTGAAVERGIGTVERLSGDRQPPRPDPDPGGAGARAAGSAAPRTGATADAGGQFGGCAGRQCGVVASRRKANQRELTLR